MNLRIITKSIFYNFAQKKIDTVIITTIGPMNIKIDSLITKVLSYCTWRKGLSKETFFCLKMIVISLLISSLVKVSSMESDKLSYFLK